jgi:hypothetical protein
MASSAANPNIKIKKGPFSLEVKGAKEIMRNLELTKNQTQRLRRFLKDEGAKVVETAQKLVPKDELRLMESHEVVDHGTHPSPTSSDSADIAVDVVAGGQSIRGRFVDYAAAVHEGYTVKSGRFAGATREPRPWLANAIKRHSPGYMRRLKKAIKIYGRRG